ncbi:serine hydrolase domain-containing protein [Zooshikella sp. RANM57]|uniref:serine hydrolase domain-containing protein n=1 Tax=Zooshikella sp. RANM57 TaxID=3425863 RepID=UPI003D6E3C33
MQTPEITTPVVQGYYEEPFHGLKTLFQQQMEKQQGASLSICQNGEMLVDIWAGHMDKAQQEIWHQDTLVNIFSCTKVAAIVSLLQLYERGELLLDKPVSYYWPAFAQNSKGQVTVEHLLTHQAGLPAFKHEVSPDDLFDWSTMVNHIERAELWWPAGTKHGYAPVTFGWMVGELFRRIQGETLGNYWRELIKHEFQEEFYIGVPEDVTPRIATMMRLNQPDQNPQGLLAELMSRPKGITARSFTNPLTIMTSTNWPQWQSMELPSANGHSTARALAKIMADLSSKESRLLKPETRSLATQTFVSGQDAVLPCQTRFGLGFLLHQSYPGGQLGAPQNFGHPGAGGALIMADPVRQLGFAFVTNSMGAALLVDERAEALLEACYLALD